MRRLAYLSALILKYKRVWLDLRAQPLYTRPVDETVHKNQHL